MQTLELAAIANPHPRADNEDPVSLVELATVLLRAKRLLALTALAGFALALLGGWLVGRYKSEGHFQFTQSLPEFKQLQVAIAAPGRWEEFTKTRDAAEIASFANLGQMLANPVSGQNLITPIYPITKADLKNLPDSSVAQLVAPISGLKLSYTAADPKTAQQGIRILGDFVRDTAILMRYKDTARAHHIEHLTDQNKFENEIIEVQYKLKQLQTKRSGMQKILHDYPEAAKESGRQVVSITEGGERYLSPVTQLVALESEIADLNLKLADIQRRQRISSIYLRYYDQVLATVNRSTSGTAFLQTLPAIREALAIDQSEEAGKSVYNSIVMDELRANALYFEKSRFIAEPTFSSQRSPSPTMVAVVGLMLGLLLGCAYVLFRHYAAPRQNLPTHSAA
ncbi:MAG: hypothetical protein WBG17_04585 [Burkholderiaceae bacterium]